MLPASAALDLTLLLTSMSVGALASLVLAVEYCATRSKLALGMHRVFSRVLNSRVVWVAVLVASLVGSRYLASHLLGSLGQPPEQHAVDLQDLPVLDLQGHTDKGRPVALFHFALHTSAEEIEQFMRASEQRQQQVIRLADANPQTNCHGWVFAGGEFGIRDSDVRAILEDNDYAAVQTPREGDVAIYTREGQIAHAGLARRPDPQGPILVESKWGPFGLYLHPPERQPFAGDCTFYRSPRRGHAIGLRSPQVRLSAE